MPSSTRTTGSIGALRGSGSGRRRSAAGARRTAELDARAGLVDDGLAGEPERLAQKRLLGLGRRAEVLGARRHLDDALVAAAASPARRRHLERELVGVVEERRGPRRRAPLPGLVGLPGAAVVELVVAAAAPSAASRPSGLRWLRQPNCAVHWSRRFL